MNQVRTFGETLNSLEAKANALRRSRTLTQKTRKLGAVVVDDSRPGVNDDTDIHTVTPALLSQIINTPLRE